MNSFGIRVLAPHRATDTVFGGRSGWIADAKHAEPGMLGNANTWKGAMLFTTRSEAEDFAVLAAVKYPVLIGRVIVRRMPV
jgi:hypothetical protein